MKRIIMATVLCIVFGLVSGCSFLPCDAQFVIGGLDDYKVCVKKEKAELEKALEAEAAAIAERQARLEFDESTK